MHNDYTAPWNSGVLRKSMHVYTGCMLLHMQGHQSAIFNRVKVIECDHAGGVQKFVD